MTTMFERYLTERLIEPAVRAGYVKAGCVVPPGLPEISWRRHTKRGRRGRR